MMSKDVLIGRLVDVNTHWGVNLYDTEAYYSPQMLTENYGLSLLKELLLELKQENSPYLKPLMEMGCAALILSGRSSKWKKNVIMKLALDYVL